MVDISDKSVDQLNSLSGIALGVSFLKRIAKARGGRISHDRRWYQRDCYLYKNFGNLFVVHGLKGVALLVIGDGT